MIIENNVINELIINKSKFITYLYKVKSIDEFNIYLNNLKEKYKDATHICYAYIIDNNQKFNDDFEPNGTAGMPILDVLKKNNLNYIACFVIRYFGGIKLGAGGLVRAYSNSCSQALKMTNLETIQKKFKIKITVSYNENSILEKIITNKNIINVSYQDNVTYNLLITEFEKEKIDYYKFNYQVIEETKF